MSSIILSTLVLIIKVTRIMLLIVRIKIVLECTVLLMIRGRRTRYLSRT